MRLVVALSLAAASAALVAPAGAQEFTLRAGADVTPLVSVGGGVTKSVLDGTSIGIDLAPGLRLAKVLTLELELGPHIPIGQSAFNFTVAPGLFVDLFLVYLRGAVPIQIGEITQAALSAAAGISFVGAGYLGARVEYTLRDKYFSLGAEVGWRFDFGSSKDEGPERPLTTSTSTAATRARHP